MKTISILLALLGCASAAEIHDAAANGDLDRINAIVKQDASMLKLADDSGDQPLHHAAEARKVAALELLIQLGAEVNAANRSGLTPLHLASKNGPTDAVEALIKAGAKADAKDAVGRTPLDMAAHALIHQRIKASVNDVPGAAEFLKAVEGGQIATLEALLAKNPELTKAVDASGNTALIKAVSTRQSAAPQWLVEHRFPLNATNRLGRTALHEACRLLDEPLVERLLKAGADPDGGEGDAGTALSEVMSMSYLPGEKAEMLPEVSPDIQRQQKELLDAMRGLQQAVEAMRSPAYTGRHSGAAEDMAGFLRIMRAQRREVPKPEQAVRLRIARLLLDHKASPDKFSGVKLSALASAANISDPAALKLLLAHGADINAQGPSGSNVLTVAIMGGHQQVIETLLQHAAKLSPGTVLPALGMAAMTGQKTTLVHLLEKVKPAHEAVAADRTLTNLMGRSQDPDLVRQLLAAGVRPDGPGPAVAYGPLHAAAVNATPEILGLLLEAGARLEKKDAQGYTPLHCAAEAGRADNLRFLISRGATVLTASHEGLTPLHSAAQLGHVETLGLLLDQKAPVDATDQNGDSALLGAAVEGRAPAVEFLLSRGADPNHEDKRGLCALDAVATGGLLLPESSKSRQGTRDYGQCAELLIKAGAHLEHEAGEKRWWTALSRAAENGILPVVEALLRHGARTDNTAQDAQGRKPLHYAAFKGHLEVVQALLKAGAKDGPTKAINGQSPHAMHFAAVNNHVGVLKALLDSGADPDARSGDQTTPLMWAASQGRREAATLLLERGADVNATTRDGATALQAANQTGQAAMVELLRRSGGRE